MLTKRGEGLTRRDFMKIASGTVAMFGLPEAFAPKLAQALAKAAAGRPKVVWLHFASDTGCTESVIKSDTPSPAAGSREGTTIRRARRRTSSTRRD